MGTPAAGGSVGCTDSAGPRSAGLLVFRRELRVAARGGGLQPVVGTGLHLSFVHSFSMSHPHLRTSMHGWLFQLPSACSVPGTLLSTLHPQWGKARAPGPDCWVYTPTLARTLHKPLSLSVMFSCVMLVHVSCEGIFHRVAVKIQ